jgi:hypothetical protein
MVGHTHDDVDQMFSRFNVGLKQSGRMLYSLSEFIHHMRGSYTPNPAVSYLWGVRDWKVWLDQASMHSLGSRTGLHGHLRPHQMKFVKNGPRAHMFFKKWARDDEWHPLLATTPPIVLLHKDIDVSSLIPCNRRWRPQEEHASILKTFATVTKFGVSEEAFSEMEIFLARTMGEVESNGFTRTNDEWTDDVSAFVLPLHKFWLLLDMEEVEEEKSAAIHESDVDTDEDEMVYQGKLHSANVNAVTNKANFVDLSKLEENSFILIRTMDDNGKHDLCLGKLLYIDHAKREVHIQWYGGQKNNYTGKQRPLCKASNPKGGKSKNQPYTDTQSFDSIVWSEPIKLTNRGHLPQRIKKAAERRLTVAETVLLRNSGDVPVALHNMSATGRTTNMDAVVSNIFSREL